MNADPRIWKVISVINNAKNVHLALIDQFTTGGILDPVKGPLLKREIEKHENFFMEIEAKTIDEIEELIKKYFPHESLTED